MARRGDGIYQRGRTWWLDFVPRGNRHVVRIGSNVNRTVAKEIAQVERGKILRGEAGIEKKRKDVPFDEAAKLFESWTTTNNKESTARFYKDRAMLAKTFAGKKLSEMSTSDLEDYKGKHDRRRTRASSGLGRFEGLNPISKVSRFRKSPGQIRFLEWGVEARLLEAAKEPLRTILLCGLDAGLRLQAEATTLVGDRLPPRYAHRRQCLLEERADPSRPGDRSLPATRF
jgi:hypothetical protein